MKNAKPHTMTPMAKIHGMRVTRPAEAENENPEVVLGSTPYQMDAL
ncbi:MAG: hypothetical protein WC913_11060 [Desulfuromonas sp.]